ncbi:uncharacterized protein MELLADRAFT_55678 [Melampsora larici-populina 98AG31]|uniref:Secreted protein n=1 Tax=Melampsora larici-populina (strain 98AG31 / pathotype 3-4-7) TaxID=747676 RepID=F4RH16_MELLP|nr:uncharacterized protein MELLADRAFT_55678 [Melampsora larici-populina 98AG31]EGG08311.1 secreted protein [Melampsora larici-populina 98AG31]
MFIKHIAAFIAYGLLAVSSTDTRSKSTHVSRRVHHRRLGQAASFTGVISHRSPIQKRATSHPAPGRTETHTTSSSNSWSWWSWTWSPSSTTIQSAPQRTETHQGIINNPKHNPSRTTPITHYTPISSPTHHNNTPLPPHGTDEYRWVVSHNKVRAKYGVQPLAWDHGLARSAKQCTQTCVWKHTSNDVFGENIAAGQPTIESVVDAWVNGPTEKGAYVPSNPVDSHFTQVVWKDSTKVGCALTSCSVVSGSGLPQSPVLFWACEYDPPGNVEGEYTQNVRAFQGGAPEV